MTEAPHIDLVDGGVPVAPPTLVLPMFDRDYPVAHGGAIYVASHAGFAVLAIGHPEFQHGFFMGLSPLQARRAAAWLMNAADAVEAASEAGQ